MPDGVLAAARRPASLARAGAYCKMPFNSRARSFVMHQTQPSIARQPRANVNSTLDFNFKETYR
jgi:hypothetical protein